MCGIVAVMDIRTGGPCRDGVRWATASLRHRGPDRMSMFASGPIALGHARLSIVDPAHGHQPMFSPDRRIVLVANAEIYNAPALFAEAAAADLRPSSHSDNEAILLAYRMDPKNFISRLRGMFAFVLVDFNRGKLIAARDRVGIKPLFMHRRRGRIIFVSEIKAALQFDDIACVPDATGVSDTLTFGYPMGTRTCFEAIQSFPSGHILEANFDDAAPVIRPFWTPESVALKGTRTAVDAVEHVRSTLEDAVGSHLTGDSDHRLYLSGGLDSSILGALLAGYADSSKPLGALSLHFTEPRFDESSQAACFAEMQGIRLTPIPDQIWRMSDLAAAIFSLEQPQIVTLDLSMRSLSAAARAQGCKVVFAGDGADELFGGYDHFGIAKARAFAAKHLRREDRRAALGQILRSRAYSADFASFWLDEFAPDRPVNEAYDKVRQLPWYPIWVANDRIKRNVMRDRRSSSLLEESDLMQMWRGLSTSYASLHPIQSAICFEMRSRLPNWILLKSDRNSMANSVEVRVPFLDDDMMDAVLSCPAELLATPFQEKLALKRAFRDILPAAVVDRPKKAFNTPHGWVFYKGGEQLDELLDPEAVKGLGLFDLDGVEALRRTVTDAYMNGVQPAGLLSVLQGQTLLGVVTTQMLFSFDWKARAHLSGSDVQMVGV